MSVVVWVGGVVGESLRVLDHISAKRLSEKHFLRVFFDGLTRSWPGPLDKKKQPGSIRPFGSHAKTSLPASGSTTPTWHVGGVGLSQRDRRGQRRPPTIQSCCAGLLRSFRQQAMTDKVSSRRDLAASGATEGPSDGPLRVDGRQVPRLGLT